MDLYTQVRFKAGGRLSGRHEFITSYLVWDGEDDLSGLVDGNGNNPYVTYADGVFTLSIAPHFPVRSTFDMAKEDRQLMFCVQQKPVQAFDVFCKALYEGGSENFYNEMRNLIDDPTSIQGFCDYILMIDIISRISEGVARKMIKILSDRQLDYTTMMRLEYERRNVHWICDCRCMTYGVCAHDTQDKDFPVFTADYIPFLRSLPIDECLRICKGSMEVW